MANVNLSAYHNALRNAAVPLSGNPASTTMWVSSASSTNPIWSQLSGIFTDTSHAQSAKGREVPCHEKMKGKERPYMEELGPRWEKAKALGLMGEMDRIEKRILKQDILEMTQGAGYPEVTDADLEALFEFPRLRRKVRWHNFKAWCPFTNLESITLRLQKDSIERARVEIPYGAMLRYEEAKEASIFTRFEVVYPNVVTETELAKERQRERDPAIVGYFNESMFLICSWDLPQDIAKAETKMDALLALKLKP